MPWLLSPTNAIDDLKIGLYESESSQGGLNYVRHRRSHGTRRVGRGQGVARQKKPVKLIVRDAKKGETWSKQGACYVMFLESAGFTKTQRTSN
jgi:hypothetical protein